MIYMYGPETENGFYIFHSLVKQQQPHKNKPNKARKTVTKTVCCSQSLKYLLAGPLQKRLDEPWSEAIFIYIYNFHSDELAINFSYGSKWSILLLEYKI